MSFASWEIRYITWYLIYILSYTQNGSNMEAIFYGSNIFMVKPQNLAMDLPYSKPEVFNKTRHGLTDIIAWSEVKPVLHPELFWA